MIILPASEGLRVMRWLCLRVRLTLRSTGSEVVVSMCAGSVSRVSPVCRVSRVSPVVPVSHLSRVSCASRVSEREATGEYRSTRRDS